MINLFKNRYGLLRSGWIVLISIFLYYFLIYVTGDLCVYLLSTILMMTGNLNDTTGYVSPLAETLYHALPLALQILMEIVTILLSLGIWKILKYQLKDLGLRDFKTGFKKDGVIGLLLGFGMCTLIFMILLLTDSVRIDSVNLTLSPSGIGLIPTVLLVGFAEELFCRGLLMSVLRRSQNKYLIMLLPSVIFGAIHIISPNVTAMSLINIILIGFVLSYMYYRSGSLWMCIGFHITWNLFQSIIYGMPVSGLNFNSLMTTHYPTANLLNGGAFGIEGGILTTAANVLLLVFLFFYYRTSTFRFLEDPHIGTP